MTVDAAIIAKPADGKPAKILLIQRKKPPCQVLPQHARFILTLESNASAVTKLHNSAEGKRPDMKQHGVIA